MPKRKTGPLFSLFLEKKTKPRKKKPQNLFGFKTAKCVLAQNKKLIQPFQDPRCFIETEHSKFRDCYIEMKRKRREEIEKEKKLKRKRYHPRDKENVEPIHK